MFDRRLIENFDWGLVGLTVLLGSMGLVILYSAETAGASAAHQILFWRQVIWFCIGLTVLIIACLFSYKNLNRWGFEIYLLSIILLICVLMFGKLVAGSRRWLLIGPLTIQPSELVKIAVVVILAQYYSKRAKIHGFSIRELLTPMATVIIPCVLIFKQPDLGTAMVIVLIAASVTAYVKIEKRSLFLITGACGLIAVLGWFFLLKEYQQQRILTFLDPDRDPFGAGYHIIQSKIAIGSGMIFGKGFLKGTQNILSFLPEQHTDFILSVLAEEWGFLGTIFVLFIYLLIIAWGLNTAHRCRDPFGKILAVGITAMIFCQVFVNAGMVMGLMPVVGVPLPLISYGGSSVVTTLLGIGFLLNIGMRKYIID